MNWELTCSTTELLRRLEPKAGFEPATTRLGGDNPILRPVENAGGWTRGGFDVSGRESNPHRLVFTRCSNAVELPSSIIEAQRPILKDDGQEVRWVVNRLSGCTGFEPDCGTRPLLPITQTQRPVERLDGQKVLWLRNRKAGLEPASPEVAFGCSIAVELHPHSVSFG